MNSNAKNKARRLRMTALCLLVLFTGFVAGRSLFVHVHQTSSGITVAHSHPYSGHHSHSAKALEAIDFLSTAQLDMPGDGNTALQIPPSAATELLCAKPAGLPAGTEKETLHLRAPPSELIYNLSL